jgi:hypothetical protein
MKHQLAYAALVLGALFELARYDVIHTVCGFGRIRSSLLAQPAKSGAREPIDAAPIDPGQIDAAQLECERRVCDAVLLATCLYWKPVLCLQRSVCATRLLRARGVAARLIIGYREAPFFSHAWVEVGSRVVNDSPAYRSRLRVLHAL